MTNNEARVLDHTTTIASEELTVDWCGDMVPKSFTVEGVVYTLNDPNGSYVNAEGTERLYLEGTDDNKEFWYAQTDPIEG